MFLRLEQRGFFLFQMTIGLLTLPPSALRKKATVILYLNFFPSLNFFPFCASPLEGRALKKQPLSSIFHISLNWYSLHNSLSRSIQEPTVTSHTSKDSPDICISRML